MQHLPGATVHVILYVIPHRGKVQTESRARFHPLGYGLSEISGIKNEFGMAISAS